MSSTGQNAFSLLKPAGEAASKATEGDTDRQTDRVPLQEGTVISLSSFVWFGNILKKSQLVLAQRKRRAK